jgi:hypothetical protein
MGNRFDAIGLALVLAMSGCAHYEAAPTPFSPGRCDTAPASAQCRIVVVEDPAGPYRCALGRFRIEPDLLELQGRNPVYIRWQIDNPSRYQFCAAEGDGVTLKSSRVADHRNVLEAFASDDDDGARMGIKGGSACKPHFNWNWANRPAGATYAYEIRFRDRSLRSCVIDPWILNGR